MSTLALQISDQEREQIERAATPLIEAARACQVANAKDYRGAADALMRIKTAQKALATKKKTVMDPLNAAVKAARALFAAPEAELDEAEGLFKRAMIAFDDEQERIRREEQRKLDEAAAAEIKKAQEKAAKAEADAKAAREAGDLAKAEKLESKADMRKRGIKSPDFADALALAMLADGGGPADIGLPAGAANPASPPVPFQQAPKGVFGMPGLARPQRW